MSRLTQEEEDRLYAQRLAEAENAYLDVDRVDVSSSAGNTPERPFLSNKNNVPSAPSTDFNRYTGTYVDVPEHLKRKPVQPIHSMYPLSVDPVQEEMKQIELRQELALTIRNNQTPIFGPSSQNHSADWKLALSLQATELEIAGDFGAYDLKEEGARSCSKQLMTASAFIVFVQTIIMIAMLIQGGVEDLSKNPMVGPSAFTMVLFGAKQGALIVYRHEGWRLFTPILLHAGIFHLLSNAAIQLFIGGYLNLVYGTPQFIAIYVLSGVFGNQLSCIAMPDTVSVGSSGAVLGILTSWLVWIVFRWKKIPILFRPHRNLQLIVVIIAIVITLAFSFSGTVDWAAHVGGSVQGFLLGLIILSSELDNPYTKWAMRLAFGLTSLILFIWASVYIATVLKPNKAYLELF